jgi:hypothetical protein
MTEKMYPTIDSCAGRSNALLIDPVTNDDVRELAARMDRRFDAVDRRFDAVDVRFTAVALRFDSVERAMHSRFESVDERFGDMTGHFDRVYGWLEKFEQERVVSNELAKRLDRRQEEMAAALVRLDRRQEDTTATLTRMAETLRFSDQQAMMLRALRRLEARG